MQRRSNVLSLPWVGIVGVEWDARLKGIQGGSRGLCTVFALRVVVVIGEALQASLPRSKLGQKIGPKGRQAFAKRN